MKRLTLQKVSKRFGDFWAVKDVTLRIMPSRITGFVGPNGAGKTTLFHLITGELKPTTGKILLENEDITGLPPWKISLKGIGKLFQDVRVFRGLTVLENIIIALQDNKVENPFWGIIHFPYIHKLRKEYEEKAMTYLEFVGLQDEKNKLAEELSFGQQKLLSIARLIAKDLDVLLLDEPTAGVHPTMIRKIEQLLRKLVDERKKTIAIIEHNMSVILSIADWVYFMNEGKIEFFGKADHILGAKEVKEAYIGI